MDPNKLNEREFYKIYADVKYFIYVELMYIFRSNKNVIDFLA